MNIGKIEHSRCDDGIVMIHTEGDVLAFIDSNKASPFDEQLAARICVSFNAYDDLLDCLRLVVDEWGPPSPAKTRAAALLAKHGGRPVTNLHIDTSKLDEPILDDRTPVYADFMYVADGEVVLSDYHGITVREFKFRIGAKEIRRCDLHGRGLLQECAA